MFFSPTSISSIMKMIVCISTRYTGWDRRTRTSTVVYLCYSKRKITKLYSECYDMEQIIYLASNDSKPFTNHQLLHICLIKKFHWTHSIQREDVNIEYNNLNIHLCNVFHLLNSRWNIPDEKQIRRITECAQRIF